DGVHQRGNDLGKVVPEGILPLNLQRGAVKGLLLIEVPAHAAQNGDAAVKAALLAALEKLCIKNPVNQIIYVAEMIVEALAAHTAGLTVLSHADFGEGLPGHQPLHGLGQRPFGKTGVRHVFSLPMAPTHPLKQNILEKLYHFTRENASVA